MKRFSTALCLAALVSIRLAASTYYVSSSVGSDSNNGTSPATPWKTLAKVNATTLVPGDSVLLARGNTWRESLVPPASGTSASPITFDAYGAGPAPVITGYQDLSAAPWTLVSGNLWQTSLAATAINNVRFGTIWGQKQTSQSAIQHDRDFYFSANKLYIYSVGSPATAYGFIAAITTAVGQLIYVNAKTWLRFQHISLAWFDGFGVNIAGASDHLVFANMESNGIVPAGTLPHGFYMNANSPGDISFYNVEAHLNYDGFKFDGTATAITLINCKAYANRDGGVVDNTGHATYSYSHFYANNIAIFNSQDIQGGAHDGGHNLAVDTLPAVVNFATYPARLTFTVDDVGFAAGTETYVDSLIPLFDARGVKLSAAVVAGYSSGLQSEIQSWVAGGHDVNSHSWSHQYYTNTSALTIRYTGSGTAATLTIGGNHLTTTITGGSGGENLNYDLADPAFDTVTELIAAINARSGYAATLDTNCRTAAHTLGLADVNAQDIKSAVYTLLFQKDRLEPDELASSKNWLQSNISGLSNLRVFVYPDGIEDSQTQAWAVSAGYEGARGALSIGLGSNFTYSKGVNIQNITSLGISGLHGLAPAQIDARIAALVFKASVWGVPYGLFVHVNDLTPAEVATILDSLRTHGAQILTNTQLMDWIAATANLSGTTSYVSSAPGPDPDLHFTNGSPVLNAGTSLGSCCTVDLAGLLRPQAQPWDIGAYSHLTTAYGSGSGPGSFTIGGKPIPQQGAVSLPLSWVNNHEADPPGSSAPGIAHTNPADGLYDTVVTATTLAQVQSAANAWASGADSWTKIKVTAGDLGAGTLTIPYKANATKFLVIESSNPTSRNPLYVPCAQYIWDNADGSNSRNPGCASDLAHFWKITRTGGSSVVTYAGGANHVVIRDLWVYDNSTTAGYPYDFAQNSVSDPTQIPTHVGIEFSYFSSANPKTVKTTTFLRVNCSWCWAMNNYLENFASLGQESHGIVFANTPGPVKIVGNFVEGGSIPFFSGGTTPALRNAAGRAAISYDIEVRRNRFTHDPAWHLDLTTNYTLKNAHEYKQGRRVLEAGNIYENSDTSGGQNGVLLSYNIRSCSAGMFCLGNEDDDVGDITLEDSILRHGCTYAINIGPRSSGAHAGQSVSKGMSNTDMRNILVYDVGNPEWSRGGTSCGSIRYLSQGANGTPWGGRFAINSIERKSGVTYLGITGSGTAAYPWPNPVKTGDQIIVEGLADTSFNGTFTAGGICNSGPWYDGGDVNYPVARCPDNSYGDSPGAVDSRTVSVARASNVVTITLNTADKLGTVGRSIQVGDFIYVNSLAADTSFNGTFKVTALQNSAPYWVQFSQTGPDVTTLADTAGHVELAMIISYAQAGKPDVPPTSVTVGDVSNGSSITCNGTQCTVTMMPYMGAPFHQMNAGDPIQITDCADPSFDSDSTVGATMGTGSPMYKGPLAMAGTNPYSLTVSFLSNHPAGSTYGCQIWNGQGWAKNTSINHAAFYFYANTRGIGSNANYAAVQNATFKNSIFSAETGGTAINSCNTKSSGNSSAYKSQGCAYDLNTLEFHNLLFPAATGSNAHEFPGDGTDVATPTTLWYPANNGCSGALDSTCLGLGNTNPGWAFSSNPPDYHSFKFNSGSFWKGKADDGKDLGPDIDAIDQAFKSTKYTCKSYCGATGPYTD